MRGSPVLRLALLLAPAWAAAQPPPAGPSELRTFCDQEVDVRVAPADAVTRPYRRFLGVWSDAAWDPQTCAALIVETVAADGTASIVYVYGPLGSDQRKPGGVLHGTGIIRDGELRFQNRDGTQFSFRPGIVDLDGRMTTPQGASFTATFKKNF
jgi:hypothetical protein